MKYLVIQRSDGRVSVRACAKPKATGKDAKTGELIRPKEFDYEAEVANWESREKIQKRGWTAVSWFVTDEPPAPGRDSTFRNAFEVRDGKVEVNMERARGIHMDRIREVRDKELARLDVEYMRALETNDTVMKAQIEGQKQALRDIPQTFDLEQHKTPEDLKAAWPGILTE